MTTATASFLGEVGDKVSNIPVSIRYAKYTPGRWNGRWHTSSSMFIIAEADTGEVIKISGSSQSLFSLDRGDKALILNAKVKGHGEYRGTPQTILSHVKAEKQSEEEESDPDPDYVDHEPVRAPIELKEQAIPTTLTKFAGAKRANYEELPTIDVEILPDVHHCDQCEGEVVYERDPKGYLGTWKHVELADNEKHHRGGLVHPKTRCRYCHSEEHAVYRQHAWHDAVECSRCGGQDGRAIGD